MTAVTATERWVAQFVIGLGLCPFAAVPFRQDRVLTLACPATTTEAAFYWAGTQMQRLLDTPPLVVETSLLVFTHLDLADFEAFLDFVAELEHLLDRSGASGDIQLAHFHPDYRFAETEHDDPANYTNRSPYPTVQLLRVVSVAAAVAGHAHVEDIPRRNVDLLRQRPDLIALRRGDS